MGWNLYSKHKKTELFNIIDATDIEIINEILLAYCSLNSEDQYILLVMIKNHRLLLTISKAQVTIHDTHPQKIYEQALRPTLYPELLVNSAKIEHIQVEQNDNAPYLIEHLKHFLEPEPKAIPGVNLLSIKDSHLHTIALIDPAYYQELLGQKPEPNLLKRKAEDQEADKNPKPKLT